MVTQINRQAYQRLIDEDIVWLLAQPRTLEREHIHEVLLCSPGRIYDTDITALHEEARRVERDYILPCFPMAEQMGIDLPRLVRENAGQTCVVLLIDALRARVAALGGGRYRGSIRR